MYSVIIPMAGSGSRAKTKENKALTLINNKPMFLYSYELFKSFGFEIVLVCKKDEIPIIKKYVGEEAIFAIGGATRANSVYNGLLKCSNEYVMIHDAARPFISKNIILDIIKIMKNNKAAYVGIPVKDTIRDKKCNKVIDRSKLVAAQTPQVCRVEDLRVAYEIGFKDNIEFTDDIMALEKYSNIKASLVMGSDRNYKVTTPIDLKLAELIARED